MGKKRRTQHTIFAKDRRLLAPEVVQTSAMDCGPAALKCLLDGFGLTADYGRLREACQTDVDGASIDTLEDVAQQLGLLGRQVLAPADHLFLPEAGLLPGLVVTVQPTGATHFVVVWRVLGPYVQVMDPAAGRRWLTRQQFMQEVYRHQLPLPAPDWRAWAGTDGFCTPLRTRLRDLGLKEGHSSRLVAAALADPGWRPLAALDAAARLVLALIAAHSLPRGSTAARLVDQLFARHCQPGAPTEELIPAAFWSVQPCGGAGGEPGEDQLIVSGAVVMVVRGRRLTWAPGEDGASAADGEGADAQFAAQPLLPPDLAAALAPPVQTLRGAFDALRADGLLAPGVVAPAVILAAGGVTLEAALFRSLMAITEGAGWAAQPLILALGIFCFGCALFLLEGALGAMVRRLGRRLETRLRIALLSKIPRLGDRYFHSRLIADMAHRAYSLHQLHGLPGLGVNLVRQAAQLLFTAAGVAWLAPGSSWLVLVTLSFVFGVTLLSQPLLRERDLRVRTHTSALSRFYLDALLGLLPIRTHSAERALRREHEMLLVRWARATQNLAGIELIFQGVVALVGIGSACWIVLAYLAGGGEASGVLLLLYWALNLPALSQELVNSAQRYPAARNHLLRVLEPLSAPEEETAVVPPVASASAAPGGPAAPPVVFASPPVLSLQQVTVVAAGRTILADINLAFAPGEHVAIVGASGAGKSSLVGLLLGWQHPAAGQLLADGAPLTGPRLAALRRATAWVDPAVQLWNRSLAANLRYGELAPDEAPLDAVLVAAELFGVLQSLPEGLASTLGEGGGLVSGGEGQRVRLGRALLRSKVQLAILDEPFRGLDRRQRRQLLATARRHWQAATLLCITHDISETQDFPRVLVLDRGRLVEDGSPQGLLAAAGSRYRSLWDADAAAQQALWGDDSWRLLQMVDGQLWEEPQRDR